MHPAFGKFHLRWVHYATVVTTSIGVKRFEWGETRPVYRGGYFVTWQEREDSNPGPSDPRLVGLYYNISL